MMKWSIFDPRNQATLNDVREKYGVSAERLAELKVALAKTKHKFGLGDPAQSQAQAEQRYEAISALQQAVKGTHFYSRHDVLHLFNQETLKTKVKDLMQRGLNVAYVDAVNAKAGATKVYQFETDKSGRIRLLVAKTVNPQEASSSGLYSVNIVEYPKKKASSKIFKARSHYTRVIVAPGTHKPRKPRISIEAEIKA